MVQGYSEPGAGSDLASVKTSAVRGIDAQGEHHLVNGQKTWTTLGHYANMIFCLVRTATDVRKQEGISFLLIDMNTPGVEVRPIVTLDGEHEVNEVFFTDVRVPAANLVGEENRGWTYAKYLLTYERTNIAESASRRPRSTGCAVAAKVTKNGRPLADDPFRGARRAGRDRTREHAYDQPARAGRGRGRWCAGRGKLDAEDPRHADPPGDHRADAARDGAVRAAVHRGGARCRLRRRAGRPDDAASAAQQYFNNRKLSIFGGSNEIQKNIIAKMMLATRDATMDFSTQKTAGCWRIR